jgi:hypothetical protein
MKLITMLLTTLCMAALANQPYAQIPAGFVKGTVTLSSGTVVDGYIKESIKKNATLNFIQAEGAAKIQYDGNQISAATIDSITYQCIKGDFFKVISNGKIAFLQKASNAANKASYNGTEAVFTNGTEGKIGDYFVYTNTQLTHLNKKTVGNFITQQLGSNTAAVEKAKAANGDITLLADAVSLFNNTNNH